VSDTTKEAQRRNVRPPEKTGQAKKLLIIDLGEKRQIAAHFKT
jgi:hypothetical protein